MKTFKKILLLFLCLALAAELGFLGIMMMKEPSGPADPTEVTAPATQAPTQAPTEPPTEAPTEAPQAEGAVVITLSDEQILDTVREKIDPNTVRDGNNNEHKEVT